MTSKAAAIETFDPNGVGMKGRLFGLPFTPENAEVVIIPVPWEVTVSYGAGTAQGPQAILDASPQIDYQLLDFPEAWKMGVALDEFPWAWADRCQRLRGLAEPYIAWLEEGNLPEEAPARFQKVVEEIEQAGLELRDWLAERATYWRQKGKLVGVVGGDHSTPLGLMQALAGEYDDYGILQIDAHMDLREAYEGFRYSHASIMTNALELPQVSKLVQVGIRDWCQEEWHAVEKSDGRVRTFFDQALREKQYQGASWRELCEEIVGDLPQRVYVSFDIDGLDPKLCPNTGTPVPGGLELEQVMFLFKVLVRSGREIVGFDLNEVAPGDADDWDGNVGARILYRLTAWAGASAGRMPGYFS